MHTALKLSLIALISLVFCPACGQTEAGGTPVADVKATEVTAPETAPQTAPEKAAPPATLDEALALAKAEGKNLLVEYTSTSCPFCRQMFEKNEAGGVVGLILLQGGAETKATKAGR